MNECAIMKTERLDLTFASTGFCSRAEMKIFCSEVKNYEIWIKEHS